MGRMRGFGSGRPLGMPADMRVRGPRPSDHASGVQPVRVVPSWIGTPSWGSKTDQKGLAPDGKKLTLAEVKTEDESTAVFTVTVSANSLVKSEGSVIVGGPVSALVEWGTAGAVFQMVLDVYVGCQFSLAASWIRVSMLNEAFTNLGMFNQTPVQASASISQLPTSRTLTPITKTVFGSTTPAGVFVGFYDTDVPAGSANVLYLNEIFAPFSPEGLFFCIPPFAKSLILHAYVPRGANPGLPGARKINFLSSGAVGLASYPFIAGEKQLLPVTIPAGTVQIALENTEVNDDQKLIPQFFLEA